MAYKAIEKIGEYEKGEIVPEAKAIVWMKMYKISPVELVEGEEKKPITKETKNVFDLNNDGVVDTKDAKLASKVMNAVRRNKKSKK